MAFASSALAAPPAAGTVIGNQAVATFESGGQTFSVTSNLVQTTINTIAGVQIETDTTKSAVAGGKVLFPHTITNVGNAADRYNLTTTFVSDSGLSFVGIYADGDCDGVPDTLTSIDQTGSLNAGESACVVVEVNVAAGATGSPTFKITAASTLTTASNFTAGTANQPNQPNDTNTDTVTVTTGAVFEFTKTMSLLDDGDGSGSLTPGDTVRVRFNYSNTGGADAANVIITDVLPTALTYVADKGQWSDGGTMADAGGAVDHTNGQGHTISYSFGDSTVKATLSAVPVGKSGYIEFVGTVATGAAGTISNTGTIDSDQTDLQTSNEARLVINDGQATAVTLADRAADPSYAGRFGGDLPDVNYTDGGLASSTDDDNGNNIDVSDAFVLGNGADVTEVGGVALGSGSVSDTGADVAGYVPGGASTADQNAIEATQSTRGAVAVGNPDAETGVYRQITGVAAGTADSDAANVAQLKSVETIAKTGWKLTTDSGSIDGIGPGDELVLKGGDGNIVISNQILSNDVSIDLADEIEVNRVTARDPDTGASTVLDENGLSFTTQDANGEDTALGPRVTAAGIQAAGKITNVAAGEADTDAVNFSQLRQVETASGNTDQRAVKYDWTDANTNGVIDEGELNLDSVTLAGGMGGTRISNLAPGALSAASTDAVNGSQLFGLRSRVSNVAVALGGGAAYDPVKDEWIAPKYTIGGTDYSNVGDALAAVGGTAGAGWSLSAQGANASNVAPGETVDLRNGDGNIVVSKAETGDTVSFDLADDLDVAESITVGADPADPNAPTTVITGGSIVIGGTMLGSNGLVITGGPSVTTDGIDAGGMKVTNVANGTVAKDSKDAVNGDQLFDVVAKATANGVGYDDKSKGTLTLEGADGTKITNVAAGDLNANSTDAVNGSQLYATNVKVDRLDTEVKEIDSRVTYIESFQGDLENAAVYDTDAAGKRLNTLTLEGGDPNKPVLIANVATGVKATDAVNVGQLDESVAESKSYTDEKTEWAIDQAAIYTDQVIETKVSAVNNYAQQRFAQLSGEIGQVRGEARQAAAIGLAAASLRFDNEPGKLSVALGGGFWRSEGALAFGAGYTSEDGRVRANLTGAAAGGNVGVGAGLSITLN
ncbi:YadA-like family protein [Sinorhizobium meliloti]|nr:YadA-like family protein [Sinorhizobium meliloti]WQP20928.1 YadA-like family protein [Sinorhizobium meliloti]WQP34346.1 YadA-like family protein [Sinorhizobium meliloti]